MLLKLRLKSSRRYHYLPWNKQLIKRIIRELRSFSARHAHNCLVTSPLTGDLEWVAFPCLRTQLQWNLRFFFFSRTANLDNRHQNIIYVIVSCSSSHSILGSLPRLKFNLVCTNKQQLRAFSLGLCKFCGNNKSITCLQPLAIAQVN